MARRSAAPGAAGATGPADPLERSARFWLRAYPRRWRSAFGDDFVGVLSEVSEPGTVRVPAREAVAIVQGGWALRLREHPPLLRWLGYRLLDRRLPAQFQHWVADDLFGAFWFARYMASGSIVWCIGMWFGLAQQHLDEMLRLLALPVIIVVAGSLLVAGPVGRPKRRTVWQRHISVEAPLSLLSSPDQAMAWRDNRSA